MARDKEVDAAVKKVAPGFSGNEDSKWKVESALRDLMAAETHRQDPDLMKDVKKRVKGVAKSLGC
jgi:hypothetical protein